MKVVFHQLSLCFAYQNVYFRLPFNNWHDETINKNSNKIKVKYLRNIDAEHC